MAELLAGILQQQGVTYLIQYLDDFLTIGPPNSDECQKNLETMFEVAKALGVPLATDKVARPSRVSRHSAGHPQDGSSTPSRKVFKDSANSLRLARKKECEEKRYSIISRHSPTCIKGCQAGRTFVARLYATVAKVAELEFITRLNKGFRSDLW